jgi:hypothetical protein
MTTTPSITAPFNAQTTAAEVVAGIDCAAAGSSSQANRGATADRERSREEVTPVPAPHRGLKRAGVLEQTGNVVRRFGVLR